MKILYLVHRIPYPPNKGDKIRSFNEIKYLSEKHEIHLCCLVDNSHDLKHRDTLMNYCQTVNAVSINTKFAKLKSVPYLLFKKPLSVPYFYSPKLQKIVNRLLSAIAFDCILCFSSPMAEYIFKSIFRERGPLNRSARLIMDFVDVDSDKWLQYSKYEKWPLSWVYRSEGNRLAVYERKIAEQFDHSIFVSPKEVAIFKSFCPLIKNVTAISNGVDYEYFSPNFKAITQPEDDEGQLAEDRHHPILLFTGAMDYYANVDGVIWFCREIFSRIQIEFPKVSFYIVGSNPHPKLGLFRKSKGIRVTGFVEDVRPYYRAADICVIPLRLARGIQNKVLEAMAMEKAVVCTSMAIQGIEAAPDRQFYVGDNPKDFASGVMDLLKDTKKRMDLGQNGRDWVMNHYNWSLNMKKLENTINL